MMGSLGLVHMIVHSTKHDKESSQPALSPTCIIRGRGIFMFPSINSLINK